MMDEEETWIFVVDQYFLHRMMPKHQQRYRFVRLLLLLLRRRLIEYFHHVNIVE
jgi:hypothetical protein